MLQKTIIMLLVFVTFTGLIGPAKTEAAHNPSHNKKQLFETMESLTHLPWYYLAAIDQYERNLQQQRQEQKKKTKEINKQIFIRIPKKWWAGAINPNPNDTSPITIQLFQGIGLDGDGDQKADPTNAVDVLYSLSHFLTQNGTSESSIREQLWKYYQHPTTVDIITHTAQIFRKLNDLDLEEKHFPIPLQYNYTYRSTWGDRRGWGGVRIHEGTDIFADYGTPVLSTCYGYIELIGWNRYGGWRIGIRDVNNNYHYFAHLNGFRKGLKKGMVVKPGEQIGSVGSSGYGPPGTAGKFPPHLHFGLYRFDGRHTYSVDPYASLKLWEKVTKKRTIDKTIERKHAQPNFSRSR